MMFPSFRNFHSLEEFKAISLNSLLQVDYVTCRNAMIDDYFNPCSSRIVENRFFRDRETRPKL